MDYLGRHLMGLYRAYAISDLEGDVYEKPDGFIDLLFIDLL